MAKYVLHFVWRHLISWYSFVFELISFSYAMCIWGNNKLKKKGEIKLHFSNENIATLTFVKNKIKSKRCSLLSFEVSY